MTGVRVGVFDSGLGGLSIAREIRTRLPAEQILYVADTAFCPYGDRPDDEVRARSLAVCEHLVKRGAKVVVVACNTASGAALEHLRAELPVPVIGTEPAVKPAVAESRNGRVGVMATTSTVRSARFRTLVEHYAGGAAVITAACPGLADLVEIGQQHGPAVRERLRELLRPLREAGVDTLVLGCTHYPFLADELRVVMGPEVRLLDSGAAIARQTERVLAERGLLAGSGVGDFLLETTGDPAAVREVAERLWGRPVPTAAVTIPAAQADGQLRNCGALPSAGISR